MSNRSLSSLALIMLMVFAALGARCWTGGGRVTVAVPETRTLEGFEKLADAFPAPDDAPLAWPRDHGAKPEQFAESWLFAGMLEDRDGERYGFQLAFYRLALRPDAPGRESAWATRDVYRARLSVEPAGESAESAERLSRSALGLAGAEPSPARTWVENWSFAADEVSGGFRLSATDPGIGLELRLIAPAAGPVPVQVAGRPYRGYWWPGLDAEGALLLKGRRVPVAGRAMLDRLWGRALPAGGGQLALARLWLEDGDAGAVRCEQLRRRSGGGTPITECLWHPPADRDTVLEPVDEGWRTVGGIRYPLRWALESPAQDGPLLVVPLALRHAVSPEGTWSGVVSAAGREGSWGLLELSNFGAP